MKKKLIIEIFLLFLILTISILIFNFYFNKDEKITGIDKTKIKESDDKPTIDERTSSVYFHNKKIISIFSGKWNNCIYLGKNLKL